MFTIGPVLPGRIPGSLVTQRLNQAMASNHRALVDLQGQLSTGQRFFLPSEDPAAASRAVILQSLQEHKGQFLRNVQADQSLLSSTDVALTSISDVLNRAKQLAHSGIGASESERQALAVEANSLIRQAVNVGNSTFRGRHLFGGSQASSEPYAHGPGATVIYSGDRQALLTRIDFSTTIASNVTGHDTLGGLSSTASRDVNPALTLATKLKDLNSGAGVRLGAIEVSLSAGPQTATVDLTGADTISDIKTRIESAFAPGDVTVAINATQNGLQITAAAGTVTIADPPGGLVAADLGITGGPAASLDSGDLDPALTTLTTLASLNGGTGIGPTAGTGLRIVNGATVSTVDLTGLVTIEDLFNRIRQADPHLSAELNTDRNGLEIASRLSGVDFSIGENNGQNATLLGIRTLISGTLLSDLNHGSGVPVTGGHTLDVTRRDGTTVSIDLSTALTVQDVLDAVNAVDPGNLVASLVGTGNGLQLTDNSGTGPLTVSANPLADALGLTGIESGADPLVPLIGNDVNPHEAAGTLNVLLRLQQALENGNPAELSRLSLQIDSEITRVVDARAEIGGRLKSLEDAHRRLEDEDLQITQALSETIDADLAEVLTQLVHRQTIYQAVLQTAAQSLQLGLLNYL